MTNPTSNFGWQMPTSTDLVTDLPADFEVFGQAVDTAMADLKGGTTGQLLSKASNTNMDFVWTAAPSSGGMTLLSTTTLSGASVTISVSPSGYNYLYIQCTGMSGTGTFRIAPNNSTTSVSQIGGRTWSASVVQSENTYLTPFLDATADGTNKTVILQMYNVNSTTEAKPFQTNSEWVRLSDSYPFGVFSSGIFNSTSTLSSLVFTETSGNFSSGTVKIYGVK